MTVSPTESTPIAYHGDVSLIETPLLPWKDILTGNLDHGMFQGFTSAIIVAGEIKDEAMEVRKEPNPESSNYRTIGGIEEMPRFWILTDHKRRLIILIFRGTMSLNKLAVDLPYDFEDFIPYIQGYYTRPLHSAFTVHGGLLRLAKILGGDGSSVHAAVNAALDRNDGYGLVMIGHGLGAGIVGLLALMWAYPKTRKTHSNAGLPRGRSVHAYCVASPRFTSAGLSRLAAGMITSLAYKPDVISRFSSGSIGELSEASWWTSDPKLGGYCPNTIKRSWGLDSSMGFGWWEEGGKKTKQDNGDLTWKANMQMANMHPPGTVWRAVHESDIDPFSVDSTMFASKLSLAQIGRMEKMFG